MAIKIATLSRMFFKEFMVGDLILEI